MRSLILKQIFDERMNLIKKWVSAYSVYSSDFKTSLSYHKYAAWSEEQKWSLLVYILKQLTDDQLMLIHGLLDPSVPQPDQDFTRILPKFLCLKILSMLDPQSLCRASQVHCYVV